MLLGSLELNRIYQMDCLEGMKLIPDKSIDMILCDLPYGTTSCKWDTVIPFEPLWDQYERIIKDNGAIVLFGSQPFTSALVMSNPKHFREELIWNKDRASNFANAKIRHLKYHENILVFSKNRKYTYNRQMQPRESRRVSQMIKNGNLQFRTAKNENEISFSTNYEARPFTVYDENLKNPSSVIYQPIVNPVSKEKTIHPTQKPVALCEYLIKTYSNEGEIVLDNCMGSGTTAIAAVRTNRNFIGFETEPEYVRIANQRLENVRDEVAEQRLAEGTDAE
jgi:site-specific DNA-methyltransferase (adenine-specific)